MPRGISIHIGLNQIDPAHYGTDGRLGGCENDARSMHDIAESQGYETSMLLTRQATSANVLKALYSAAASLVEGDILLITYAGHGSQVPDVDGDEDDHKDETWCLYDRMLLDDELYRAWEQFQPGVRIFMLSDSCHSGSIAREIARLGQALDVSDARDLGPASQIDVTQQEDARALPEQFAEHTFSTNEQLYTALQLSGSRAVRAEVGASVLLISGCQDNQTSADLGTHGRFTAELLNVWDGGRFSGSYYDFHKKIVSRMPPLQTPRYYLVGAPNPQFEAQRPFSISARHADSAAAVGSAKPVGPPAPALSPAERLAQLKAAKHDSRALPTEGDPELSTGVESSRCKFEIAVERDLIEKLSDQEVYDFLRGDGSDVLMKAFLSARSVVTPRGANGEFSCSADSKGGVKCEGGISIRF